MPPLALDPTARLKIGEPTLRLYRKCALELSTWLLEHALHPQSPPEWDDLLVEWKQAVAPTKSAFSNTLASLEFFFPHLKGQLQWSHQIKAAFDVAHVPQHTVPMLGNVCRLYAIHFSVDGHPSLAIGCVLQQSKGLRPSEMLGIDSTDVALPEENQALGARACVIALGVKTGTKAKRAQSVVLPEESFGQLIQCLRVLKAVVGPSGRLFPYTLSQYNRMLKRVSKRLGIDVNYTPHSLRAGFASEGRILGKSFVELREEGRWVSDSSLRIYVDIVSSTAIARSLELRGLKEALGFASTHWPSYLARPWVEACHGHQEKAGSGVDRDASASSAGATGASLARTG